MPLQALGNVNNGPENLEAIRPFVIDGTKSSTTLLIGNKTMVN